MFYQEIYACSIDIFRLWLFGFSESATQAAQLVAGAVRALAPDFGVLGNGDSRENISALTEKQVPHSIVGSVDRFSVVHLASSVVPLASVSRAATSPTSTFSFFLSSYLRFFMFSFSEVSSLASTVGGVAYLLLVREM